MFRKNVAGQYLYFALVNATTGAALTGATVTGKRSIDGAAQASVTGTISEDAGGQYHIALSQADTNGNDIGYLFTATNAIPVSIHIVTTAADPTDSVRFGLTAMPNAAAGANGGLPTGDASGRVAVQVGTGTGQINSSGGKVPATLAAADVSGNVAADVQTIKTQAVTCAAGVTVLASVGTASTSTAQTGDAYARIGAAGAGLTALGDTRIANLDAAVSSRSTYAGTDTAGTTTLLSRLTSTRASLLDNLDAAISLIPTAVWAAGTRTLSAFGFTVATNSDTNVTAIKAKTDNLPASPAAVSDIPTANANADALLDRADAIEAGWTLRKALRIISAACAGKLSGAATTTATIRNITDTKARITATTDADGNRTAVTLDGA